MTSIQYIIWIALVNKDLMCVNTSHCLLKHSYKKVPHIGTHTHTCSHAQRIFISKACTPIHTLLGAKLMSLTNNFCPHKADQQKITGTNDYGNNVFVWKQRKANILSKTNKNYDCCH